MVKIPKISRLRVKYPMFGSDGYNMETQEDRTFRHAFSTRQSPKVINHFESMVDKERLNNQLNMTTNFENSTKPFHEKRSSFVPLLSPSL